MTVRRSREQMAADTFTRTVGEHRAALDRLDAEHASGLWLIAQDILRAWQGGGKLLVCGNGGSAADSQHLAAELVGRYRHDRAAWSAVALTLDTSALTAISNDYGFEHVFARQIEALGRTDDVLLILSTSGNSPNCLAAARTARINGLRCHGLLGRDGGALIDLLDSAVVAPSDDTPRIQELHGLFLHLLCELIESAMAAMEAGGG